jgi:hypothetical protein
MADMIRPCTDQDLEGNGAFVLFFGAFGMAWGRPMVAGWSAIRWRCSGRKMHAPSWYFGDQPELFPAGSL